MALAGPLRSGDGQEQAELEAAILASLVQEEAAQSEGNEQAGMEAADGEQSEGKTSRLRWRPRMESRSPSLNVKPRVSILYGR